MATLERPRRRIRGKLAVAAALAVIVAAACTLANPLDRYQAEKDLPAPKAQLPAEAAADAGASWKRYALDYATMTWSPPVLLTDLWSGPNAPPPRGIVTAVQFVDFDRLILFTNDGKVYTQADGVWRPPVTIADAWSPLPRVPPAAYHVPSAFEVTVVPDASAGAGETITFIDSPNAYLFSYSKDDKIAFTGGRPLTQDDGGPSTSLLAHWSFEVLDLGNPDLAQRYRNYTLYEDGILYGFWADFSFHNQPIAETPLWKDKPDAPPPQGLTAAYFDQAKGVQGTAYFIGP